MVGVDDSEYELTLETVMGRLHQEISNATTSMSSKVSDIPDFVVLVL